MILRLHAADASATRCRLGIFGDVEPAPPLTLLAATEQAWSALSWAAQQETTMTTPADPPKPGSELPPGVPKPPSKADLDQISGDQALITDEWAPVPAPPSKTDAAP